MLYRIASHIHIRISVCLCEGDPFLAVFAGIADECRRRSPSQSAGDYLVTKT